jgi:ATP-dependent Clp protease ATP-binding subunit ClpC
LKNRVRPEFLNRLDASVVFHSLGREELRNIVDLMLGQISGSLKEKNITINVTDAAKDLLGTKGYDPVFGARPLRRVIQNMLEDQLSDAILRGEFQSGDTIEIDCEDDHLVMHPLVHEAV